MRVRDGNTLERQVQTHAFKVPNSSGRASFPADFLARMPRPVDEDRTQSMRCGNKSRRGPRGSSTDNRDRWPVALHGDSHIHTVCRTVDAAYPVSGFHRRLDAFPLRPMVLGFA